MLDLDAVETSTRRNEQVTRGGSEADAARPASNLTRAPPDFVRDREVGQNVLVMAKEAPIGVTFCSSQSSSRTWGHQAASPAARSDSTLARTAASPRVRI